MNQFDQKIMDFLEIYKRAVEAKDVNLFLTIYDPEVVIFDMWGKWIHQGLNDWKKTVQDWFDSLGNDKATVEINDIQIITDQCIASLYAIITFKGISESGESSHEMDNRFTWILKSQNGTWKILHEHSSAPIDFESTKVILKRSSSEST